MANATIQVLVGIDVGTSGVRAVAVNTEGRVLARTERPFSLLLLKRDGLHEQSPEDWWKVVCEVTRAVVRNLQARAGPMQFAGVAITSTSGTLVLADQNGCPVRNAILYDDTRGSEIAKELNAPGKQSVVRWDSSCSLIKAMWVRKNEPQIWDRARYILHPADWLSGRLTNQFGVSDWSNALKLGYDPEEGAWSKSVSVAQLPRKLLPHVVRPGKQIGTVAPSASEATGLPRGTPVMAGITDGMASMIASGASLPGDAVTTLGTTVVWKMLSRNKPQVAQGMYCHLHPSGFWAPGAASNTGLGSIQNQDHRSAKNEMDRLAEGSLPSSVICYILRGRGERFPFQNGEATTFVEGTPNGSDEWHAAQLQSLAFVERWGYEKLDRAGIAIGVVYSSGGGAGSRTLCQLRSTILHRRVLSSPCATGAFGAAMLAASGTVYSCDISQAIQGMTAVRDGYEPEVRTTNRYDELYGQFREACARRGYH